MVTTNKIEYKDARLVRLSADAITHKPDSLAYPWSLFIFLLSGKSCWVQSSTQGFIPPIVGDRWMVDDFYEWKSPGGLRDDSFRATVVMFIYDPH